MTKSKRPKAVAASARTRSNASTPKLGRPTAARTEAINGAIIASARKLFLANGYEATSIDDIATAARVSKATLYGRYPTKELLRRAVVMAELAQLATTSSARITTKPKQLKRFLQVQARGILASLISTEAQALDRLIGDARNPGGDLADMLYEYEQAVIAGIARDIMERADTFATPLRSSVRIAEILVASLYGWRTIRRTSSEISIDEAWQYADDLVEALFVGRAAW